MSSSNVKYRPDIDGLRGVAVLLVLLFHSFPIRFKSGFIGVDVFFVISGYLITTITVKSFKQHEFNLFQFFKRRIVRLFPSLILILIFCFCLSWIFLFPDEFSILGKNMAAGAAFVANFFNWTESGYFDTSSEFKPLLHLWSLGVEEQFYVFWPILILIFTKKNKLFRITIAIAIVSFIFNLYRIIDNQSEIFYLPFGRIWEILSGAILAQVELRRINFQQSISHTDYSHKKSKLLSYFFVSENTKSNIGLFLLIVSIVVIDEKSVYPGWRAALPCIATLLILSAGVNSWLNRLILSNKFLVWMGLISYPLYLWHWPIFVYAKILLGSVVNPFIQCTLIVVSILLAALTYEYLERPAKIYFREKSIAPLVLSILFLGLLGFFVHKSDGLKSRSIGKSTIDFLYDIEKIGYSNCSIVRDKIQFDYCLQKKNAKISAVIIGDSHAEDKFHGLVESDLSRNWALIGQNSCPPVYGINVVGAEKNCRQKFEFILDSIENNNDIKLVLMSFYWGYYLSHSIAADHLKNKFGPENIKIFSDEISSIDRFELFYYGLNKAIGKLIRNKKVILSLDVPELPFFPKDCVRFNLLCSLKNSDFLARQKSHRVMVERLLKDYPQLLIYDPSSIFCNQGNCFYMDNDVVMYRDSHHLSLRGSKIYANQFLNWLNQH